jgi:hypothetical protein
MFTGSRQSHVGWSLAAALSLATLVGCGGGGGHGGSHIMPPASSDAYAALSWQIYDVGGQGPLTCDEVAGYSFSVSLIDSAGNYYDGAATASCSPNDTSFQATTFYVPAGYYSVEFYLYGNSSVYASSNVVIGSYRLDNVHLIPGANNFVGSPQAVYVESFVVGWTLALSGSGRPSACNPGEIVEFEFSQPGTNAWIVSDFDCAQYAGTSFPIPVDYRSAQWNLYLLDSAGQQLDAIAGGTVSVPDGVDIKLPTQALYVSH